MYKARLKTIAGKQILPAPNVEKTNITQHPVLLLSCTAKTVRP
jgi:hypothetical protein